MVVVLAQCCLLSRDNSQAAGYSWLNVVYAITPIRSNSSWWQCTILLNDSVLAIVVQLATIVSRCSQWHDSIKKTLNG